EQKRRSGQYFCAWLSPAATSRGLGARFTVGIAYERTLVPRPLRERFWGGGPPCRPTGEYRPFLTTATSESSTSVRWYVQSDTDHPRTRLVGKRHWVIEAGPHRKYWLLPHANRTLSKMPGFATANAERWPSSPTGTARNRSAPVRCPWRWRGQLRPDPW